GAYRKPEGQLALARLLLDRGANIDARQESSRATALIDAARAGWLEMVELLLGRGADVHLADIIDTTALSGAARGGHADVVKRLLAAGARLAMHGDYGESPLERAIDSGHVEIVRLFLERGALDVRSRKPPLFAAAAQGNREIVELLLEAGADIHDVADSYDQDTALRKAADAGHRDIVELLIERGAREPGLREGYDKDEYTAIRRAGARGHLDVVQLLAERGFGDPRESGIVTGVAEASDDPAKLERALAIAPDVEAPGRYGWTALHRAADRGYAGNVRVLLDHGADPNRKDKDGNSPHRIATDRGHRAVVELLEARGAKLEFVELIDLAATGSEADVLAMLARPVDVNVARDGRRPLHVAAEHGRVSITRALLDRGAEVDAVDQDGWTALMEAADMGHVEVVELLLDRKAAPFVADRPGFTAYSLAEEANRADVVALLRARSADVDPAVAFQIAIEQENVAAVTRLAPLHGLTTPLPSHHEPLEHAVRESKPKAVAALIAAGAEVDRTLNEYGYTPLFHAADRADLATVRVLLDAGAKPRANGTTLRAAVRGELEMVAALLDAGFDIDELQDGRTLVQAALESGRDAVVRFLLDRGASVRGRPGAKLLSRAAWHEEHAWLLDELLARGAPADGSEYSMLDKIETWVAEGRSITLLDPQAALSYSTWHDRLGVMELALAQGANPSAWHEESDERPILRAASSGYWRLVERLLAAGADPDVSTYRSLAQAVAEAGEHALLAKLAQRGARMLGCINAMLRLDKLPADPEERGRLARLCLAHGDDLDTPDHEGTPLLRALRASDEPLARWLVELGASVNAPDERLVTPLMLAAETGTLPLVRWFVEAGADVMAVSKHQTTAIHYAARAGKEEVVAFLLERGASVTGCLRESAASGKRALVERFLPLCDLEEKADGWHITPAMNAAGGPSKKVFELLLDRGASVEYCAITAAEAGNKTNLAVALERGAKVDTREWIQRTALMVASDHPACIELLLKAGASVDLQDEDGRTALMHAANDGNKKSCQLLLAAGANRGLRDTEGRAAIDYARHDRALRSILEV
ncbi:MAG: ankyrin repeat domain-containing protein, partial [Myxococcales bacterium]|nr:ankyrin repeat domain-containing protein [Myxococcales bacterium]